MEWLTVEEEAGPDQEVVAMEVQKALRGCGTKFTCPNCT